MTEIVRIIDDLTRLDPTMIECVHSAPDAWEDDASCWFCGVRQSEDPSGRPMTDPGVHRADCIWLRARNVQAYAGRPA